MKLNNGLIDAGKDLLINSKTARDVTLKLFENNYYKKIVKANDSPNTKNIRLVQYYSGLSMARSLLRNFDEKYISKRAARRLIDTLVQSGMYKGNKRSEAVSSFKNKHGMNPPFFITISPTKKCNLCCTGCYASSKANTAEQLDWTILDRTIREAHDEMGMRFFVISGGEPFMYESEGKNILDLPRKWADSYFLIYTNGTLINENTVDEIAQLGNVTPAISVEGYEAETDARRGTGVYQKILNTMKGLREAGVIFGASVTATRNNASMLLGHKFYKYYFEDMRVSYMWLFQYMPIGRKFTTDLMLTPEQRFGLFKQWRQILKENQWFVADFWNSALISDGCMSCARPGGYFYIDWNGNIMPCVFVPYYKDNVKQLYEQGKTLQDALFSDFFVKGREWQTNYIGCNGNRRNMLMPCFIRDHHKDFVRIARDECHVLPEDISAEEAMDDPAYHTALIEFDEELKKIEDPYWEKEFKV